jgi:tRNA1(Val) A37 N6-methylase TrmN6
MTKTYENTTCDAFLGGALHILQPATGYRAATDPVFLAASIPAREGQTVLEIGCGVGVALLCLGSRVPDLALTGLELQPEYVDLARKNLETNDIEGNIICGDLRTMPREILDQNFDHVMFNPPFYETQKVSAPIDVGKSTAHVMDLSVSDWINVGIKRLKPKGRLTLIHRVDALPEALGCLSGLAGDITVKPLAPRKGQAAKRVIITCRKGTNGPPALLSPLVIHESGGHNEDKGAFSPLAESILRNAKALAL